MDADPEKSIQAIIGGNMPHDIYDVVKRNGGWSVDRRIGKNWAFEARFGTRKEALAYVASKRGRCFEVAFGR